MSEKYEQITKRLITLDADVIRIKTILDNNTSAVASLRGLVNRKLGGKNNILDEEENPRGIEDGFDELRKINNQQKS